MNSGWLEPAAHRDPQGFAPARICIAGENLDWMGGPTIVGSVSHLFTRTTVRAIGEAGSRAIFQAHASSSISLSEPEACQTPVLRHALTLLAASVVAVEKRVGLLPSVEFVVDSNIPLSGGLASSASLCAAAVSALYQLAGHDVHRREIAETAFRAEAELAGVPCGRMDQYAVSLGGNVAMDFRSALPVIKQLPALDNLRVILVASTECASFTALGAELKRRWLERDAKILRYIDHSRQQIELCIGELHAHSSLTEVAAAAINRCHDLIEDDLGIVNEPLRRYVHLARAHGATCAKSTGARPTGGTMFAITNSDTKQNVVTALRKAGAHPIEVHLGGGENSS